MALIKCPECGKEISDKAKVCIQCGYPIAETMGMETNNVDEELVLEPISDWNSEDNIFIDCKRGKYIKVENGIMSINLVGCKAEDLIYNFSLQFFVVHKHWISLSILNVSKRIYTGVFDVTSVKNVDEFNRFMELMDRLHLFQNRSWKDEVYHMTDIEKEIVEEKRNRYQEEQSKKRRIERDRLEACQNAKYERQQRAIIKNMAKCPRCGSTSISYDTKKLSLGRALVGDAIAGSTGAILGGLSSKKGYGVCLKCGKRWKV